MIHLGWDVYRWTVRQMQKQPDTAFEESHSAFIKKFEKDQNALLAQGLNEEDIRIMLDLLV